MRTSKAYGEIYDHFSLEYEYPDGSSAFTSCRQIPGCWNEVGEYCMGTSGNAKVSGFTINSESASAFGWDLSDCDARYHDRRVVSPDFMELPVVWVACRS